MIEKGQIKRSSLVSPKQKLPQEPIEELDVTLNTGESPDVKAIPVKPFLGSALLPNLPMADIKDKTNMIIGSYQITKTLG
jgi:altronate dehydratase